MGREQDRNSSELWKIRRSKLATARFETLEKKDYQLPIAFQHKLMNICSFDPLANRKRITDTGKSKENEDERQDPPVKLTESVPDPEPAPLAVFNPVAPRSTTPPKGNASPTSKLPIFRINGLNTAHQGLTATYTGATLKLTQ